MATSGGSGPANIEVGQLGQMMLDAARSARIGVAISFVDTPTPQTLYVSEAAAEILGWPIEELYARNPLDNIAGGDAARVRERWLRRQAGDLDEVRYELTSVSKDGRETPIELTASRVTIEGRPAVFAFLVDVSARREAERQQQHNEARLREVFELAPELVGIIQGGHFVYANRAYVSALGYADAQELSAIPISALVEPDEVPIQRARESALVSGAPQTSHVYRARRKDGTPVLLEASSVYFVYAGQPAVLAMARDVTQKMQLERQLVQADRLAALGTLAAGVAHEINNPLAYVMLNLEWIARKLPSVQDDPESIPGLMAMLEEARQGADRVSVIVRELRSFSRADGETRRHVDVAAVVQSAIRIVGNEIRHRARVTTTFEAARPVLANEARLEQVVINLLLNAAQSMPEGQSEQSEIRIAVRARSDRLTLLEVWDNGCGIAPEVLPRIFDPFFTTRPVGVGTGLGLSICHGIIMSLGGRISVHSEPGEGTTFRVELPATETLAADSPPMTSESPPSRDVIRARVLVVDDEPGIAQTLRDLLAPEHHVVSSTSAREALAVLEAEEFDVVFCDLMMPGMSGIELFERVRARGAGLESRIVFMTGGAFTTRAAEFLAAVPNRRIEKPFSLVLIERIVRDMVRAERAAAATH